MPGIYGDLEIEFSYGSLSTNFPPIFLDKQTLCYASGHCIQLLDVLTQKHYESVFTGKNLITGLAFCSKEQILAVSEKGYPDIQLLVVPTLKAWVNQRYLLGLTDDSTVGLAFTSDTSKLISLGSAPTYTIALWDWRKGQLLCQVSNGGPASQLSSNPLNPHQICTSGNGNVRFWWIREGYKKFLIKPTTKDETFIRLEQQRSIARRYLPAEKTAASNNVSSVNAVAATVGDDENTFSLVSILDQIRDVRHEWNDQNQVLLVTQNYEVVAVDSITNECKRVLKKGSVTGKIRSIGFTLNHLVLGKNDGSVQFFPTSEFKSFNTPAIEGEIEDLNQQQQVQSVLPLFKGSDCSFLSFSSDHKIVAAVSAHGDLQIIDSAGRMDQVLLKKPLDGWIGLDYLSGKELVSLSESGTLTQWRSCGATSAYSMGANTMAPDYGLASQSAGHFAIAQEFGLEGIEAGHQTATVFACHPFLPLLAVGTRFGYLQIYLLLVNSTSAEAKADESDESAPPPATAFHNHQSVTKFQPLYQQAKLIFSQRCLKKAVEQVFFEPNGKFLAASAQDEVLLLNCASEHIGTIGFFKIRGVVKQIQFVPLEDEKSLELTHLYVLTHESNTDSVTGSTTRNSLIFKFTLPISEPLKFSANNQRYFLPKDLVPCTIYRLEDLLSNIYLTAAHLSNGRDAFYAFLASDLSLRNYNLPLKKSQDDKGDTIAITNGMQINQFEGHQKDGAKFCNQSNREWLISYGSDGCICMRSLLEPEKYSVLQAHSSFAGGVKGVAASRDVRFLASIGADGIIRFWGWKYTVTGKRIATDTAAESDVLMESQKELFNSLFIHWTEKLESITKIAALDELNLPPSLMEELTALENEESNNASGAGANNSSSAGAGSIPPEAESIRNFIIQKAQEIKEKVSISLSKNSTAPAMEKLELEEFIIDEEENERLLQESKTAIETLRKEIEWENDKKKVLFDRLKNELWDLMLVKGQSVKSFSPSSLSNRLTEVQNYPLKQLTPDEEQMQKKVLLLRKLQLSIDDSGKKRISDALALEPGNDDFLTGGNSNSINNSGDNKAALKNNAASPFTLSEIEESRLLFDTFALTTRERKNMQILLLQITMRQIKLKFNKIFDEYAKLKREEIAKIEDRNDRIREILAELGIHEEIFIPRLDDDEVPERVVTVLDSEVKCEKFITQEELKRMEEQKKMEEQRKAAEKDDNWRERAILQMMNGRLEDGADKKEKEELIRPDWMNKPKNEMTEDERKQVKEFEKRVATLKEEQEKHRKALETELRKIQAYITELCSAFDVKLAQFFQSKIHIDHMIYQLELQVSKLQKSLLFSEDDESKEAALVDRLNYLKQEKAACVGEIPEIKKDLEHCREDYEMAVKRDKEFEKLFKKEFHSHEFHYDALWRLFKRRDHHHRNNAEGGGTSGAHSAGAKAIVGTPAVVPLVDTMNPFELAQAEHNANNANENASSFNTGAAPSALNPEVDMPEGLQLEVWNKLVEFRDKKIALEQDVKVTGRKFNEMQSLVSQVVHDSDRIKTEMDTLTKEFQDFLEYKFMSTYNLEGLFFLKQGQVEVPQAPVLTDYADAVMIHRSVVERLNEQIVHLGQGKVEALVDMKNYRKGIHALEWENKVLDFQADNLIDRTRDIQLLRVTKQMQDYIRSGDETKQSTEVSTLEKRMEHNAQTHVHKVQEKKRTIAKLQKKIHSLEQQNVQLDNQVARLEFVVQERETIHNVQEQHKTNENRPNQVFQYAHTRSKYLETIKQQEQDLSILRQEVERLRWKTVPHLTSNVKHNNPISFSNNQPQTQQHPNQPKPDQFKEFNQPSFQP